MKPSPAQLRELRRENMRWPIYLTEMSREEWPADRNPDGPARIRILRSRAFLVQVFEDGGTLRLSVNRTEWDERANDWRAGISWDDLQQLKRDAGYGEHWAVELFPAEAQIVNVANMRHLWLLPEAPEFAWTSTRRAA